MESSDVIRSAVKPMGIKAVAHDMHLSASLLYKWCEPKNSEGSADNPLDRVAKLYELTGDRGLIQWLCQKADGSFLENTTDNSSSRSATEPLHVTGTLLKEFSDVIDAISKSIENDGVITGNESHKIRNEWEELKNVAERFVRNCEKGCYS
jgi:hypothetical protein